MRTFRDSLAAIVIVAIIVFLFFPERMGHTLGKTMATFEAAYLAALLEGVKP